MEGKERASARSVKNQPRSGGSRRVGWNKERAWSDPSSKGKGPARAQAFVFSRLLSDRDGNGICRRRHPPGKKLFHILEFSLDLQPFVSINSAKSGGSGNRRFLISSSKSRPFQLTFGHDERRKKWTIKAWLDFVFMYESCKSRGYHCSFIWWMFLWHFVSSRRILRRNFVATRYSF